LDQSDPGLAGPRPTRCNFDSAAPAAWHARRQRSSAPDVLFLWSKWGGFDGENVGFMLFPPYKPWL